jgi:D-xylose transport system permease protein
MRPNPSIAPDRTAGGVGGVETLDADAASDIALTTSPEVVAATLGDVVRGWWVRVRSGESGVLPVLGGLVAIVVIFQVSNSLFLSAGNIVNLLIQAVVFMMFSVGEVFVLLLGEIDLSVVYVSGIGAGLTAALVAPPFNLTWWLAILAGLAGTTIVGFIQGTLITRLGLPSFIVTLGGFIGWEGVMLWMFDHLQIATGGVIEISNNILNDLVNGTLTPAASWIVMIVAVGLFAGLNVFRDANRKSRGLVAPPWGLTGLKIAAVAVAGVALVLICDVNRGSHGGHVTGVPWAIPIVLVVVALATFVLGRTRFGRYIYAIGGNAEAARRAGINLTWIRTAAFAITGLMAGVGGIMYLSWLGSISTGIDSNYVLYSVAAAVIGGTSLFGGRGKPVHAVLGSLVIAAIANGLGLLGMGAAATDMVTALVLVSAVTVDSVARRGSAVRGAARR